jgi:periplasmic protein TonB
MYSSRDDEPKSGKHRTAGYAVSAPKGLSVGSTALSPFERVFTIGRRHSLEILISCFLLAGMAHGAVGAVLVNKRAVDEKEYDIIDVELPAVDDKKEPEKPKEPEPPPPEPTVDPASTAAMNPKAPENAKPDNNPRPQAGSLGNLLAQKADPNDPKSKDDPYTFETDPEGKEFAGGTSQMGGGDKPGAPGAVASGAPGGTGTGEAKKGPLSAPPPPPPAPTVDLSKAPMLNEPNACKGFFPADADDDAATVQVLITVQSTGAVTAATVLKEDPKGQGFGKAARTCLLSKKFAPGLDKLGNPAASTTTVNLRFVRY